MWGFEVNSALKKILDTIYLFVVCVWFNLYVKRRERLFGSPLLNVPNVSNDVPISFYTLCEIVHVSSRMHIFSDNFEVSFLVEFIRVREIPYF